jgi:hypothetical protein
LGGYAGWTPAAGHTGAHTGASAARGTGENSHSSTAPSADSAYTIAGTSDACSPDTHATHATHACQANTYVTDTGQTNTYVTDTGQTNTYATDTGRANTHCTNTCTTNATGSPSANAHVLIQLHRSCRRFLQHKIGWVTLVGCQGVLTAAMCRDLHC